MASVEAGVSCEFVSLNLPAALSGSSRNYGLFYPGVLIPGLFEGFLLKISLIIREAATDEHGSTRIKAKPEDKPTSILSQSMSFDAREAHSPKYRFASVSVLGIHLWFRGSHSGAQFQGDLLTIADRNGYREQLRMGFHAGQVVLQFVRV